MNKPSMQALASEIAANELRQNADHVDRAAAWPEESLRALQRSGLTGLVVAEKFGGLGQGLLAVAQITEILARECASTAMCFGMHCVGSAVIGAKATEDQAHQYLVPIASGQHITTLSLSEPGTGSHFYFPETTLRSVDDNCLEVHGTKSFVTNGSHADSYVVSTVAADPMAPPGEFSLVLLPRDLQGMSWKENWNGFGMRGNSSISLHLEHVRIPARSMLGQQGDQIWYVFEIVAPYFLVAMAGTYLGIADAALAEAIAHLKERSYTHSGGSLSSISVLQHRLGVLWSRLESSRQLIYSAAKLADDRSPAALLSILSAKAEISDCTTFVVNEVMTLMGGKGYDQNGRLGRLMRDARAAHVMAPTTDILRTWTGRALLDLPLLSED